MLYPAYFFDLDGTLYRGEEVIEGAPEALHFLRDQGAKIFYATNNSGLEVLDYARKLAGMGFPVELGDIVSSATATAGYLVAKGYENVWVIGEPGLVRTLRSAGIDVLNADDSGSVTARRVGADALVVGICRTALSFELIDAAMQVVINGGDFMATNPDKTFPLEAGRVGPGNGAVVAALTACTGREPTIVGKPEPLMAQMALERLGLDASQMLVVGDRMDTDIECGRRAGCPTMLVLSGVLSEPAIGTLWIQSVAELRN
jgi:4-nitrophenyl phosphatase